MSSFGCGRTCGTTRSVPGRGAGATPRAVTRFSVPAGPALTRWPATTGTGRDAPGARLRCGTAGGCPAPAITGRTVRPGTRGTAGSSRPRPARRLRGSDSSRPGSAAAATGTTAAACPTALGRSAFLSHANQPSRSCHQHYPDKRRGVAQPYRERPSSKMPGGVLLSHAVPRAVPSALKSLTSGFGMGPGVSPSL
jgi:hypothetical protein